MEGLGAVYPRIQVSNLPRPTPNAPVSMPERLFDMSVKILGCTPLVEKSRASGNSSNGVVV